MKDVLRVIENEAYSINRRGNNPGDPCSIPIPGKSPFEDRIIEKVDVWRLLRKLPGYTRNILTMMGYRYTIYEICRKCNIDKDRLERLMVKTSMILKEIQKP